MASKIEDLKMDEPTRRTHITVRFDEVAMDRIHRFQAEHGGSRSRAVEMLIKGTRPVRVSKSSKPVSLDEESRIKLNEVKDAYRDAAVQLQRIGNNVNQIAKKINTGNMSADEIPVDSIVRELKYVGIGFEVAVGDLP